MYGPYNTIGSLAQLFCHNISLINNEVLVKNLEVLAAL